MTGPSVIPSRVRIRFSAERKPTDRNTVLSVGIVVILGVVLAAVTIGPSYAPGIIAWEFGHAPSDPARLDELRDTLAPDLGLILGYVLALGGLALLGRLLAFTRPYRMVATVAAGAVVAAGLVDLVENLALATDWRLGSIAASAVFATAKFALLLPGAVIALWSFVVLFTTAVTRLWVKHNGAQVWQPTPSTERWADESRWDRAYLTPGTGTADKTAICLSGGGVRSASVALGAMQSLTGRGAGDVRPDYVVSVSGGGYTAGAFLQAMRRNAPKRGAWPKGMQAMYRADDVERPPLDDLFAEGSEEYDYIRRRSSYIADSPAEMIAALVIIAKNMLLSLTILFTPAVIAGVLAGLVYAYIPMAAIVPVPDDTAAASPEPEHASLAANSTATLWVLGVLGAICFLLLVVAGYTEARSASERGERWRGRLSRAAVCFAVAVAVIAVLTVVAPGLMRLADTTLTSSAAGIAWSASAVALLNYVAVLAAILWRNRGAVGKLFAGLKGKADAPRKGVPRGALQLLLVLLTLTVVLLTWFATFGGVGAWTFDTVVAHPVDQAAQTRDMLSGNPVTGGQTDRSSVWWVLSIAVILAVTLSFYDVTSSSLQPFYRRRLARAFAVRRMRSTDNPGQVTALPYPSSESTELTDFDEPDATPHFVFAAAATISGSEKPAAGLNAVPFTFGTDYVGGPDVGWVSTHTLQRLAPPRIRRDLTVQAAVAVSGAAFASAMGRMGSGYQKLFAISGARLGTWLPNPMFLAASAQQPKNWAWPHGLPRYRGAGYLYREVLGINSARGRLLQISDGGHYENLGLVEALRRRCTTIVCIDASGDTPPNLSTLADAVRLARAELGVTFTFPEVGGSDEHTAMNLAPGSGEPFDPDEDFEALNARITQGCVVTATITYPPLDGRPTTGRLILAKAVLWQNCPDWLMTYANTNPVFPHDSTSDQWFDEGQFAAYTELGRLIGAEALRVIGRSDES